MPELLFRSDALDWQLPHQRPRRSVVLEHANFATVVVRRVGFSGAHGDARAGGGDGDGSAEIVARSFALEEIAKHRPIRGGVFPAVHPDATGARHVVRIGGVWRADGDARAVRVQRHGGADAIPPGAGSSSPTSAPI